MIRCHGDKAVEVAKYYDFIDCATNDLCTSDCEGRIKDEVAMRQLINLIEIVVVWTSLYLLQKCTLYQSQDAVIVKSLFVLWDRGVIVGHR